MPKPKLNSEDEETKKVAKALGVDLGDDANKKAEKESDSDKKTDTEAVEKENRNGESDKPSKKKEKKEKDDIDYKKLYADSTREHQTKYKPLEDKINKLQELSGKNIDILLEEFQGTEEDKSKKEEEKKDAPNNNGEKEDNNKKISSLEEKVSSIEQKIQGQEEKDKVIAKKVVDSFKEKHEMSDDEYVNKINPLLEGIMNMKKSNGDPYSLEEGLDMAYIFVHKDNIDKIVDVKMQIKQKENDLAFSPTGSKESSKTEREPYSEQEKEIARKMGVDLTKEGK